jgi:DNA-binding CsgD family transcriptional regulator
MADAGVVLMDRSLRVLGCDPGAAAILNAIPKSVRNEPTSWFPHGFLDNLRRSDPSDLPSAIMRFHVDASEYTCRASLLTSTEGFSTLPIIAVHLENASAAISPLDAAAAKYYLTPRERDVLQGISKGLRTKELAVSLNISPSTVKVFLRLVMIKMGATTRSAVVSKIFQNATAVERQGGPPQPRPANRLAS